MIRAWAGFAAALLFSSACTSAANPSASAASPPQQGSSPGATDTAAAETLPPAATSWELIVDDPAWVDADLDLLNDVVSGGPGLVSIGQTVMRSGVRTVLVFASSDGRSWRPAPVDLGWQEGGLLASGSGGLVAVGRVIDPQTSESRFDSWHTDDGDSWERGPTPRDPGIRVTGVIDDGPGFLAVGCEALQICLGLVVLTSDDGSAFVRQPTVSGSQDGVALGVASGDAGYLAWATDCIDACAGEHVLVWLSEDGTSWSPAPARPSGEADDVAFAAATGWGDGYVAVGLVGNVDRRTGAGSSEPASWISQAGQEWQRLGDVDTFQDGIVRTVLNVGDHLIAAGAVPDGDFTRAALWTSGDGSTWQRVPDDPTFERGVIEKLAIGPAGLVALGRVGHDPTWKAAVWVGPLP